MYPVRESYNFFTLGPEAQETVCLARLSVLRTSAVREPGQELCRTEINSLGKAPRDALQPQGYVALRILSALQLQLVFVKLLSKPLFQLYLLLPL